VNGGGVSGGLKEDGVDLPVYRIKFGETCSERKSKAWEQDAAIGIGKACLETALSPAISSLCAALFWILPEFHPSRSGRGKMQKNEIQILVLESCYTYLY
jgi:hypothetical protein